MSQLHQHYPLGVSFHDAVSPVISFIQFLGIMPLKGLKESSFHDFKAIKFAYMSFSMLSCLTFLICDLIVMLTYLMYLPAIGGLNIFNASMFFAQSVEYVILYSVTFPGTLIFHSIGLVAYLGFLHLASKWQHIITKWVKMESRFLRHPYTSKDSLRLKRKVVVTSSVIAVLSLVEHALFQGSMIYGFIDRRNVCGVKTEEDPTAIFLKERFPYMLHAMPHIVFLWINQVNGFSCCLRNFLLNLYALWR